jgi:outer membrane protein assembly factor BamB
MRRRCLLVGLVFLGFLPAVHGVITASLPLSRMLADAKFVVTVKVDSIDADKPAMVLITDEDLKGKLPVRKLLVNLAGDAEGKKADDTKKLLKRIAPKTTLVLFLSERGKEYSALGYCNGTWFQMLATKAADVEKTVFAFTHCEPYLRRTFKGTTEEMKKVVDDAIAGKAKPPDVNDKEPPGLGPELMPEKPEGKEVSLDAGLFSPRGAGNPQAASGEAKRQPAKLQADKKGIRIFGDNGVGMVMSSPVIDGKRLYLSVSHGAIARFGVLYCLDLEKLKTVWTFDADKRMKDAYSSPCIADGRIFVGEGLHQDQGCKLYCLDAKNGKQQWEFATRSHTEATPIVSGDKVFFGAGDDGIYCADAANGKKLWQYTGPKTLHIHVDSTPALAGKHLYCGSGLDEDTGEGDPSLFCLEADTGKQVWLERTPLWTCKLGDKKRTPQHVPAWASPVEADGVVYFGVGNGRVNGPSNVFEPAGGVLAINAATGKEIWPAFKCGDGVLHGLAVDADNIYFGCRDGHCYAVDRKTGKERWKVALGSAVIAAPVLARSPKDGSTQGVFCIGSEGQIVCLDPQTGKADWRYTELEKAAPLMVSTPAVVVDETDKGCERRLYFGACFDGLATAALCRLQDFQPRP